MLILLNFVYFLKSFISQKLFRFLFFVLPLFFFCFCFLTGLFVLGCWVYPTLGIKELTFEVSFTPQAIQFSFEVFFALASKLASFDINSLFTNIPLDETIEIILNQLFYNNTHFQNFTREQFKELLNLTVKNCHFIFNGKF